jgi:hypothetical protein
MLFRALITSIFVMALAITVLHASVPSRLLSDSDQSGQSVHWLKDFGFENSGFLSVADEPSSLFVFGLGALLIARVLKIKLRGRMPPDLHEVELPKHSEDTTHGKLETANSRRIPEYVLAKEGVDPSI